MVPNPTPAIPIAPTALMQASPVAGIAVPTAPRSLRVAQSRTYPGVQHSPKELQIRTDLFDLQPPRGPSAKEAQPIRTTGHRPSVPRNDDLAERRIPGADTNGQKLNRTSPYAKQNTEGAWQDRRESVFLDRRRSSMVSTKSSEPYTPAPAQTPSSAPASAADPSSNAVGNPDAPRKPVLVLRTLPARSYPVIDDASESDSGDDLNNEYFEAEIKKTEDELEANTKLGLGELFFMEPLPLSVSRFAPYIEFSYETTGHQPLAAFERCVVASPRSTTPDAIRHTSAVKQKRSKSRPTSPNPKAGEEHLQSKPPIPGKVLLPESLVLKSTDDEHAALTDSKSAELNGESCRQILEPRSNSDQTTSMHKRPLIERFEESDDDIQTEEERIQSLQAVRRMMQTPPLEHTPRFDVKPWHAIESLSDSFQPDPLITAHLKANKQISSTRRAREITTEQQRWRDRYLAYRLWTDLSDDAICIKSRDAFVKKQREDDAHAAKAVTAPSITENKPESSRRTGSRFATEHDIERVLRESELEAQVSRDKDTSNPNTGSSVSKEADIPDMAWDEEEWLENQFVETNHIVPFERSFARLEFGEPVDNFTEEESAIFERTYLEVPKQWGKIAEALPFRDYKACIQHYYLVKHSSNIKEKLKKQPKRRKRARGVKPKSSALMTDLDRVEDVDNSQDTDATDRRRPRRAAAPTWEFQETLGSESKGASPAATPSRKVLATPKAEGDSKSDAPPAKKRTRVARDKTKQARSNQVIAAAPPAISNVQPGSMVTTNIAPAPAEWHTRPSSILPYPPSEAVMTPKQSLQHSQQVQQPSPVCLVTPSLTDVAVNSAIQKLVSSPSKVVTNFDKAGSTTPSNMELTPPDRRASSTTSSYWSVPEQTEFPTMLAHFGTDWQAIAKFMGTKTHIMVCDLFGSSLKTQ